MLFRSFKTELYQGIHNLASDAIMIALYTASASLDSTTTAYTTNGEASGGAYIAGGQQLQNPVVGSDGTIAYVSFSSVTWSGSITARGALIYNASKGNRAIAVLNFGSDKISTGSFTVTMPAELIKSGV